jgi:RHS repeat-associated protein
MINFRTLSIINRPTAYTAILLFFAFTMFAKEKRFESDSLQGPQINNGAELYFIDPELNIPNIFSSNYSTNIELKVKDNLGPFHHYRYRVLLQVIPIMPDGTNDTPYEIEMRVENNRYGGAGNYADFSLHEIKNRKGCRITVLQVEEENVETSSLQALTPSNITLKIAFVTERYYLLSQLLPTITPTMSGTGANGFLNLNWTAITGAEEYDLEWAWVDRYNTELTSFLAPESILFTEREFELNNTRVQTIKNSYSIPLVFSNGYLVFRVRAVGRWTDDPNDYSVKKYGPWSFSYINERRFVSDWQYIQTGDHESGMKNWQFQASYAEQGKAKEVVSYFDGSLRNRQTVTRINTDNNAIVGEVIYDKEGRAAIEVLPVPTKNSIIQYYPDFNRNLQNIIYSYQDLVPDAPGCDILPSGMIDKSGASKYYSKNNDLQLNHQDFVPDAQNFPFSQIKYTNDNTGRIKSKGGVGITHQIGSGHEMKYIYTIPTQEELNRLFGYSVGNVIHYKKNVVVDPNGQVSVSYLDPQGKTIATALSSGSPENLKKLDDESTGSLHETLTTDLLSKISPDDHDTEFDNNERFISSNVYGNLVDGLRYDGQKALVENATTYKFDYSIKKNEPFSIACNSQTYYYPTVYDLSYGISDDCGNILKSENKELGEVTYDNNGNVNMVSPTTGITYTPTFDLVYPKIGSYGIFKKLVVDHEKLDIFIEDYIRRGIEDGCILPEQNPAIDTTDCFMTCADCVTKYQTLSYQSYTGQNAYVHQMLDSNSDLYESIGTVNYTPLLAILTERYEREWELIIEACNAPCKNGDSNPNSTQDQTISSIGLSNILNSLLDDVKPTGQYGLVQSVVNEETGVATDTAMGAEVGNLPWSVYNVNNMLYAPVEGVSNPNEVSWKTPNYFYKIDDQSVTAPQPNAYKHYYTNTGQIDYVLVTKVALNAYMPPIEANATVEQVSDNLYKVEPQYLLNVSDFIDLFQDSWALSLVKFHPEYHYLDYKYKEAGIINTFSVTGYPNTEVNTDGFDSFLSGIDTYQKAYNAGLLSNAQSIYLLDPYFKFANPIEGSTVNTAASPVTVTLSPTLSNDYWTQKKQIMLDAFSTTPGFEETGMSLIMNLYRAVFCSGPEGNCDLPPTASFTTVMTTVDNLSTEDKDMFWDYYKSYYLGLKQKIQHVFTNVHAFNQGQYNGCIGTGVQDTELITSVIATYPTPHSTIGGFIAAEPAVTINSLNNENNNTLVGSKTKRFIPYDVSYDSQQDAEELYAQLMDQANFAYLESTGICPMLRDLQIFFNGASKKQSMIPLFQGAGSVTTGLNFFTEELFAEFGGIPKTGPVNPPAVTVITNVSGSTLNFRMTQSTSSLSGTQISLTIPLASSIVFPNGISSLTWASYGTVWAIDQANPNFDGAPGVGQIAYTGYNSANDTYNFSVLIRVRVIATGETFEVVLTGTTQARLACSVNPMSAGDYPGFEDPIYVPGADELYCDKRDLFEDGLKKLLNDMREANDFGNNTPLHNKPYFINNYLYEYYNIQSGDVVIWNNGFNITSQTVPEIRLLFMDGYVNFNYLVSDITIIDNVSINNQAFTFTLQTPNGLQTYTLNTISGRSAKHLFQCCIECSNIDYDWNDIGYACDSNGYNGCFIVGDADCDNIPDSIDNCRWKSNPDQLDTDGDGKGDACDTCNNLVDADCDGIENASDNCLYYNSGFDADNDGVDNVCDTCPNTAGGGPGCTDTIVCMSSQLKNNFEQNTLALLNALLTNPSTAQAAAQQLVTSCGLTEKFQEIRDNNSQYFPSQIVSLSNFNILSSSPSNGFYGLPRYIKWSHIDSSYGFDLYGFTPILGVPQNITDVKIAYSDSSNTHIIIKGNLVGGGTFSTSARLSVYISGNGYYGYLFNLCYFFNTGNNTNRTSTIVSELSIREASETISDLETISRSDKSSLTNNFVTNSAPPSVATASCHCITQQIIPVSGSNVYPNYVNTMHNLGIQNIPFTVNEFSCLNLQYLYEGWRNYLMIFDIHNVEDDYFITLPEFGATALNYGYNDYLTVITAFKSQIAEPDAITNWADFVTKYLKDNPLICPPAPMTPTCTIRNLSVNNCKEFAFEISEAYQNEAYNAYIQSKKDEFRNKYIDDALSMVVETYNMTYFDKEYQYTLYYYDQAGNLIRTVAPEGVKRFEAAAMATKNAQINDFRRQNSLNDNTTLLPNHNFKTEYTYNSLNQLISQTTPDGGLTRFAYDEIGRIVISQNAKQKNSNKYSYTRYDKLGRIIEAGQTGDIPNVLINDSGKFIYQNGDPVEVSHVNFPYTLSNTQEEVTYTVYDDYNGFENFTSPPPHNTRNRVAIIFSYETKSNPGFADDPFDNYIIYSYDIHGNVREMVQHNARISIGNGTYSKNKRVNYEYDLISGNISKVIFQKNKPDQFIHKYSYDADNRLTSVKTSKDNIIWENDAKYYYYEHGPLARVEIGDKQVQGVDYAYTLHGWLKAVNAENMKSLRNDMGQDGITASRSVFAKDAYGYSLEYYNNQNGYKDYISRSGNMDMLNISEQIDAAMPLYNGNIGKMVTTTRAINERPNQTQINYYHYDQLNRIADMRGFRHRNGSDVENDITSDYWYDRNGNIKRLNREAPKDNTISLMDGLDYIYQPGTNKLTGIKDDVGDSNFDVDIDSQDSENYTYDEIGQLTKDQAEHIDGIEWRADGKVKLIKKTDGTAIVFQYDGLGNRIGKEVHKDNVTVTQYARDAQGNVLGVYSYFPKEGKYFLDEHHIFGSSRLGIEQPFQSLAEYATNEENNILTLKTNRSAFARTLNLPAVSVTRDYSLLISPTSTQTWVEPLNNIIEASDINKYLLDTKVKFAADTPDGETLVTQINYTDNEVNPSYKMLPDTAGTTLSSVSYNYNSSKISISGNTITNLLTSDSYSGTKVNTTTPVITGNGYVERRVSAQGVINFGLSYTVSTQAYPYIINYSINSGTAGSLTIKTNHNNSLSPSISYATIATNSMSTAAIGDVLRVERNNGHIYFYRISGSQTFLLRSVAEPAQALGLPLYAEFHLNTAGISTDNIKIVNGITTPNQGSEKNLQIINVSGLFLDKINNTITKINIPSNQTSTANTGGGGSRALLVGNGCLTYNVNDKDKSHGTLVGLSYNDAISENLTAYEPNLIDFGILLSRPSSTVYTVKIYKNGIEQSLPTTVSYTTNDKFKIERYEGYIRFYKINTSGTTMIAALPEPNATKGNPMLADFSIARLGGTINNLTITNYTQKSSLQLYVKKESNVYKPKIVITKYNGDTKKVYTYNSQSTQWVTPQNMAFKGMAVNFSGSIVFNPIQLNERGSGAMHVNNIQSSFSNISPISSVETPIPSNNCLIQGNISGQKDYSICHLNYSLNNNSSAGISRAFNFDVTQAQNPATYPVYSSDTPLSQILMSTSPLTRILGPCLMDSDQDGIYDLFEDVNNDGNVANDNSDDDTTPDYLDTDDDGDGILTSYEISGQTIPGYLTGVKDTDGDGIFDFREIDDDNDGYPTPQETPNAGTNQNPGTPVAPVDSDNDGKPDYLDRDNTLVPEPKRDIAVNNFNRIVGDKRYELTNHLGNVLNVITDRKIIGHIKFVSKNTFESEPWKEWKNAGVSIENEEMVIDVYSGESGAYTNENLGEGSTYYISLDINRDNFPSNTPVYIKIKRSDDTIMAEQIITSSGSYTLSFVSPASDSYTIFVMSGGDTNGKIIVDNYYVYEIEPESEDIVTMFKPDVVGYSDYYPFGMLVPGRHENTPDYRYGFNGMEKDNEFKGDGNSYTTEFRQYDPRIGRWLSADPKEFIMPFQTPYNAFDNRPIITVDPRGDCPSCFSGMVAGIITEFVTQVADKMFFDGLDFEPAISAVDKSDIAIAGVTGFLTGWATGGLDKISHLFKGRYGKVTYRLIGELTEFTSDVLGQVGKDAANGNDFNLGATLRQAGYDKAASLATSGKRFSLDDSKNILVRQSERFQRQTSRASAALNNSNRYSRMAQEAVDSQTRIKYERKAERWKNKYEARKDKAIKMTLNTFSEIAGGELSDNVKKGLVSKVMTKIGEGAIEQTKRNITIEIEEPTTEFLPEPEP